MQNQLICNLGEDILQHRTKCQNWFIWFQNFILFYLTKELCMYSVLF